MWAHSQQLYEPESQREIQESINHTFNYYCSIDAKHICSDFLTENMKVLWDKNWACSFPVYVRSIDWTNRIIISDEKDENGNFINIPFRKLVHKGHYIDFYILPKDRIYMLENRIKWLENQLNKTT